MELFYVGDTVQIKVGNLRGELGMVDAYSADRARVAVAGGLRHYSGRSLSLFKGGAVRNAAITASAMSQAASVQARVEDVAAEVAANPGPIVRDPLAEHFTANPVTPGRLAGTVTRPVLPTAAEVRNLSAGQAVALAQSMNAPAEGTDWPEVARTHVAASQGDPEARKYVEAQVAAATTAPGWAESEPAGRPLDADDLARLVGVRGLGEVTEAGRAKLAAKFRRCRWCPTLSDRANIGAHEATHTGTELPSRAKVAPFPKGSMVVRQAEPDGPIGEVTEVRAGMARVSFAGLEPLWVHPSGLALAAATERPTERVYPIPRPASGHDPRFKTGLWIDVVKAIEARGYPLMSGDDMAAVSSMLFGFIYESE